MRQMHFMVSCMFFWIQIIQTSGNYQEKDQISPDREKYICLLKKHGVNFDGFGQGYFLAVELDKLMKDDEISQREFQKWIPLLPMILPDLNPFHLLMFLNTALKKLEPHDWLPIDAQLRPDYVWLVTLATIMWREYGMTFDSPFREMIIKPDRKFWWEEKPGFNGKDSYEIRCRPKQYVVRFERWNQKAEIFTALYYWKDKILSWSEIFWAQRLQHVKRYWRGTNNRLEIDARSKNDYLMHGKIGDKIAYKMPLTLSQVQRFIEHDQESFEAAGEWEIRGKLVIHGIIRDFKPVFAAGATLQILEKGKKILLEGYGERMILGLDVESRVLFPFDVVNYSLMQDCLQFGCKVNNLGNMEFGFNWVHNEWNVNFYISSSVMVNLKGQEPFELPFRIDMNRKSMGILYEMSSIMLVQDEKERWFLLKVKELKSYEEGEYLDIRPAKGWKIENSSFTAFPSSSENYETLIRVKMPMKNDNFHFQSEDFVSCFLELLPNTSEAKAEQ